MAPGAIIRTVNTAAARRATPVDTALRTTVRIPTLPARGVSILTPSIGAQKPVRPAAHRPTITRTIAILMEAGRNTM